MLNKSIKKSAVALAVLSLVGVTAAHALESSPTPLVVGFKPVYENTVGTGAFTGALTPGATLVVDPAQLGFKDEDGDLHDIPRVTYSWTLGGTVMSTTDRMTIPAGNSAVGQAVTLTITPVTVTGDPDTGNALVLSNLTDAGVPGGTPDGEVGTDATAKPIVTALQIGGSMQQGRDLTASYVFDANGGEATDASTYAWAHRGNSVAGLGTDVIATSGTVPAYRILPADAGSVMEVSVRAINGAKLVGNTLTVDSNGDVTDTGDGNTGGTGSGGTTAPDGSTDGSGDTVVPYIKADPVSVTISYTSSATIDLNGVEGGLSTDGKRPVAARDLMTASFVQAAGASPHAADYTFQWKVAAANEGTAGVGGNTFTPGAAHQGQAVTVEVAPAP